MEQVLIGQNAGVIWHILEKSEYAVTSNELKNQFDIPIQLFLSCIGYQ